MAVTRAEMQAAQATLRSYLELVFGAKLEGVSGYAARIDSDTDTPALTVMTRTKAAASRARSELPAEIAGMPVRISQRGPAIFD